MRELEPLLQVEDIMRLCHVSRVTVYKWIALARKGEGHFPLPVFGRKQKLCWHRDAVEQFCKTQPASNGLAGCNKDLINSNNNEEEKL